MLTIFVSRTVILYTVNDSICSVFFKISFLRHDIMRKCVPVLYMERFIFESNDWNPPPVFDAVFDVKLTLSIQHTASFIHKCCYPAYLPGVLCGCRLGAAGHLSNTEPPDFRAIPGLSHKVRDLVSADPG